MPIGYLDVPSGADRETKEATLTAEGVDLLAIPRSPSGIHWWAPRCTPWPPESNAARRRRPSPSNRFGHGPRPTGMASRRRNARTGRSLISTLSNMRRV
jgi:hypothetical protein